jgi:hypothetical protein
MRGTRWSTQKGKLRRRTENSISGRRDKTNWKARCNNLRNIFETRKERKQIAKITLLMIDLGGVWVYTRERRTIQERVKGKPFNLKLMKLKKTWRKHREISRRLNLRSSRQNSASTRLKRKHLSTGQTCKSIND